MGFVGYKGIITHNIDQLAAYGIRFTNFICVSTECSLNRATTKLVFLMRMAQLGNRIEAVEDDWSTSGRSTLINNPDEMINKIDNTKFLDINHKMGDE